MNDRRLRAMLKAMPEFMIVSAHFNFTDIIPIGNANAALVRCFIEQNRPAAHQYHRWDDQHLGKWRVFTMRRIKISRASSDGAIERIVVFRPTGIKRFNEYIAGIKATRSTK